MSKYSNSAANRVYFNKQRENRWIERMDNRDRLAKSTFIENATKNEVVIRRK